MAKFHTFTDFDIIDQDVTLSYGPVSTDPENKYRVTSLFTTDGMPTAYAVTKGLVFIQKSTEEGLCNLILKPIEPIKIEFKPVKYFIYRGLRLDSYGAFVGSLFKIYERNFGHLPILLNKMYEDFDYDDTIRLGLSSLRLDIDESNFSDDELIDKIFQESNDNQLPIIEAGDTLGVFTNESPFGFEIIIEEFGYYPTMKIARCSDNIIVSADLDTSLSAIAKRKVKEEILNYVDPLAYYGLFIQKKIRYHCSTDSSNSGVNIGKEDILNLVLNRFFNKDNIYIDIRNENNNSYNFQDNYRSELEIFASIKLEYISSIASYAESLDYNNNGWPILVVSKDFPIPNVTFIGLQFKHMDNYHPVLYSPYKSISTVDFDNSVYFLPLHRDDLDWGYTKEKKFGIRAAFFLDSGTYHSIPYYYYLIYNRQHDIERIDNLELNNEQTPQFRDVMPKNGFFDNIFCPFSIKALWKNDEDYSIPFVQNKTGWIITNGEIFDSWNSDGGIFRTFFQGVANDKYGETVFALFNKIVISKQRKGKYKNKEIKSKFIDDIGFKGYFTEDMSKFFFEIFYNNQKKILRAQTITNENDEAFKQKDVDDTIVEIINYEIDEQLLRIPKVKPPQEQLTDIESGDMISFAYGYSDKHVIYNNIINNLFPPDPNDAFDNTLPIYYVFRDVGEFDLGGDDDKRIYVKELGIQGYDATGKYLLRFTGVQFYSTNNYHFFTQDYLTSI